MEKEGKFDLLSVLILSILIFAVYAVLVLGDLSISLTFPANATNASASYGYAASDVARFNATNATFNCTIKINTTVANITNVSLFINHSGEGSTRESGVRNQTQWINITGPYILNVTFNVSGFDEGNYFWFCEAMQNVSGGAEATQINFTSVNRSFIIDKSGPGYTNLTNTSNADVATENEVYISANFTDTYTTIHTVRLFANISGVADTEVNTTGSAGNTDAGNMTMVNLSYTIPGRLLGGVLNFTLWANDSVNNYNITSAILIRVTQDGTPPGITLKEPIHLFNQTSPTVSFNFTAYDNNNSQFYNFTCGINISSTPSSGPVQYVNISNIQVTNGTDQVNTTSNNLPRSLSNGTYMWNVSCIDKAGNLNTSLSQNFTVDQIPPVLINLTINGSGENPFILGSNAPENAPVTGDGSWAQGRVFTAFANFTDNLTRPLEADLQYYNASSSSWVTVNTSQDDVTINITNSAKNTNGSVNLTFVPLTGHNFFEGRNVSFRVIANDSVGNVNNSASAYNVTIMINDTAKPTLSVTLDLSSAQEGNRAVNSTNTSDNTPTIVWNVTEGNALKYIAVQIDGSTSGVCNKFVNYTLTDGNVETNRNGSITVSSTGACPLANGTRVVRLTAEDSWGNSELYIHNIVVQTGEAMGISLGMINTTDGVSALATINQSNITPSHLLTFNVTLDGGVSALKNVTWTSSCQSTLQNYTNGTAVAPFNYSGCKSAEANRTVTVTAYDFADNSVTRLFQFAVDDVGPTITVHYPTNGVSTDGQVSGRVEINVSAFDSMSRIDTIGYYLDGSYTLSNHTINGSILTGATGQNATFINTSINTSAGTHTIKIRVNDTLGNIRNSSVITFTYLSHVDFLEANLSLRTYLGLENFSNVSFFNLSGNLIENTRSINQTLQLRMVSNLTSTFINTTINFNGSAANWAAINFSVTRNETKILKGIVNNFTVGVVEVITINESINKFLPDNNSYYGFIDLVLNASNVSSNKVDSVVSLGARFELWYFPDSTQLNTKTNITECKDVIGTNAYTRTTTSPCWNNTLNETVRIYVPHFSAVALVNDSIGPNVTVNFPQSTQTESSFFANITMTNDAVLCNMTVIGANTTIRNVTMSGPSTFGEQKICTFYLNITNGTMEYNNLTFHVYDANGNVNITVFDFNVSDLTVHNLTSVANTTTGSTTWTITATANESINATINYSTNAALSSGVITSGVGFAKSAAVSLSGLSADTRYYFNITTCDRAKNCIENGTYTFVTDAAAAATAAATTTTSSGGGGGGAVPTTTVAASQAQVWSTVPVGSSFSLKVDKATIAITSVAVNNAKIELKNVELEAAALTENPVSAEAAAKVYQYLRINKKNLADTDAGSFKIGFRVTKAWLTENSLASGDIALYRFKDVWSELATKVTGTDATYVNYEAETPGFSSFAIGTKSGVEVKEAVPEGEAVPPSEEVPPEEGVPTPVEAPKAVEAPGKAPTAWIIAAVVVILGIILIVAYQKKKQQV